MLRFVVSLSAAALALGGPLAPSAAMYEAAEEVLDGWQKPGLDVAAEMNMFKEAGGVVCWNGDCDAAPAEIATALSGLDWYDSHIEPHGFFANPLTSEAYLGMKVFETGVRGGSVATHRAFAYLSFDAKLQPSAASFYYGPSSVPFLGLVGAGAMAAAVAGGAASRFAASVEKGAAAFEFLWESVSTPEAAEKMVTDPEHAFYNVKVCSGLSPDSCVTPYSEFFMGFIPSLDSLQLIFSEREIWGPNVFWSWQGVNTCGDTYFTVSGTIMLTFEPDGELAKPARMLVLSTEKSAKAMSQCIKLKAESSDEL